MAKKPDRSAAPPAAGKKPGQLSEEEARLFRATVSDARKLPGRNAVTPPPGALRPQQSPKQTAAGPAPRARAAPAARLPPLDPGAAAGLDGRTMERLRRGRIRPEARLDLHGMTQKEAHAALGVFMARTERAGTRCVIVITGKGRVSEGGGVLRNELPGWLNAPAIRSRILGFTEAQPRDGGAGALYVLLKRDRNRNWGRGGGRKGGGI